MAGRTGHQENHEGGRSEHGQVGKMQSTFNRQKPTEGNPASSDRNTSTVMLSII